LARAELAQVSTDYLVITLEIQSNGFSRPPKKSRQLDGFPIVRRWLGRVQRSEPRSRDPVFRCRSRPSQPGQPGGIAGGHRHDEAGADPFDATEEGRAEAADGLASAKGFLNPLPVLLGPGIARVPGCAASGRGITGFLRDVGRYQSLSKVLN
jgi:hypothetical protein